MPHGHRTLQKDRGCPKLKSYTQRCLQFPLCLTVISILYVVRVCPKFEVSPKGVLANPLMPCGHKHPLICRWGCPRFQTLHLLSLRIADWRHPQVVSATKVIRISDICKQMQEKWCYPFKNNTTSYLWESSRNPLKLKSNFHYHQIH